MAWVSIPNSSLSSGAPVRGVDAVALRDNPSAIANGDVGAPKVQTAGINDNAITNAKLESPTAGLGFILRSVAESVSSSASGTSYQQAGSTAWILVGGVVTVYYQQTTDNPSGDSFSRILKNGAPVATYFKEGNAYTARQVDISVDVNDFITLQHYGVQNTVRSLLRFGRIYSNNKCMAVIT